MKDFIHFLSMSDPNTRYVVVGSLLLTISAAVIGCFALLRKKALVGDAVSHAVLPGICISFMLAGTKNPIILLIGAFISGWLSMIVVDFINTKTKIKEDTAIALVLSVFFGIGIMLLTMIQHSGNASQSGLDSFLFGKAAALLKEDVIVFGVTAVILLSITFLYFKEFTLLSFDKNFAHSILGGKIKLIELLLTSITVMAIVVGIQAVGVVLMSAILITPAAAARYWTTQIKIMILLAASFAGISGISGAYISYSATNMPTGPWIIVVISLIAISSFIFAPTKGVIPRFIRQRAFKIKMLEENILKALFQLGEKDTEYNNYRTLQSIKEKRDIPHQQLLKGIKRLRSHGYINYLDNKIALTEEGKKVGQKITKLHRLWEMYLTQYLRIAPDHVHEDAETIEHIITPEIEQRLEELLKFPDKDPHNTQIPY